MRGQRRCERPGGIDRHAVWGVCLKRLKGPTPLSLFPSYFLQHNRIEKVIFPQFGRVHKAEIDSSKEGKGSDGKSPKSLYTRIQRRSGAIGSNFRQADHAGGSRAGHRLPPRFTNGVRNWASTEKRHFLAADTKPRSKRKIVDAYRELERVRTVA